MAGAIGISGDVTWLVNGWGWRQLMDQAVSVAPPERRERLEHCRVQPGLTLSLLSDEERVPIAEILVRAAEDLMAKYEHHPDGYERKYARRLHELVTLLNEEITRLRSGD